MKSSAVLRSITRALVLGSLPLYIGNAWPAGAVAGTGAAGTGGVIAEAGSLATRVVERRPVPLALPAEAVIEATRQATVAAQVSGRVVDLRVDAGQTVRRGQLLLRLEAREANEAVAAARAGLANAKAQYERVQNLWQQKFVSQAAVDKARADFDVARANHDAAQAGQGHAVVLAPLGGIVAERYIEPGEMAVPGKPLLTIFEPGGLRAVASVPQSRQTEVRAARRAIVEFRESGLRLEATRITVLPVADAATHALTVRVELPLEALARVGQAGEGARPVAPGMAARVHFVTGEVARLTVPESAIVRRGAVTGVYVHAADGRLSLRQVRLGEVQANGESEVLAGLAAGERIVVDQARAAITLKQGGR